MPLWLQTQMGYIATWAGLVAAPRGVVAVFLTPFVARLMNRIDARWTASVVARRPSRVSFFMRSRLHDRRDFWRFVVPDAGAGHRA